jgi:hypothetical protein
VARFILYILTIPPDTPDSTSELSNYPDDLSFAKGEILDVVDIQEEWWQARKADRTVGSTYCYTVSVVTRNLTVY